MTDDEILERFVTDVMDSSPTFSDEMIAKVRNELLKASSEAEEYYRNKAEDWKISSAIAVIALPDE